ncbi:MAG: ABC transporter ATP-binding protein [Clostridia bacterium]
MTDIIALKNIVKQYDGKTVVNNINLTVKKGEFVTFLGPSGCGKTTTLRLIAGFEKPNEGEVLFNGENIVNVPPYKRNINTVFQKYALFPHLNVYNNISFGLKLQRITKQVASKFDKTKTVTKKVKLDKKVIDEKVMKALKIVGLTGYEKRDVDSLSGGQQQRVAIARAIVNEPEILLLDEPLGALDLKMRQEMQLELKQIHKKLGITFIYVTHDQEEAITLSDTVVVMRDGEIIQEGSPMDIYNEPINAYVADFIGESNILSGIMLEDFNVSFADVMCKCVDKGFGSNCPVDVVIRPEDFIVTTKEKGFIFGVITSSIFKGVHYEMTLKANGYEFLIHNTKECLVGSEIGLNIAPDDIHIMRKEHTTNKLEVLFKSNTELYIDDCVYAFNPEILLQGSSYNAEEDVVTYEQQAFDFKDKKAIVSFKFNEVEMEDSEYEAPLAGNVESMIYKGKNYLVTINTDKATKIYAETEYLWDDGDRVGINVNKNNFTLVEFINE